MAQQKQPTVGACKSREEDLVLFHYGDLGGAERDILEKHVAECAGCAGYLKELAVLLPLTAKSDEPAPEFWTNYNRELRHKLDDAMERKHGWRRLIAMLQPRPLPALATATVVVLALGFTLGRGVWTTKDNAQDDELAEALPVAENLEFFSAMDVLDDLDLLDFMGSQGNT
jgi:hypothetical protein